MTWENVHSEDQPVYFVVDRDDLYGQVFFRLVWSIRLDTRNTKIEHNGEKIRSAKSSRFCWFWFFIELANFVFLWNIEIWLLFFLLTCWFPSMGEVMTSISFFNFCLMLNFVFPTFVSNAWSISPTPSPTFVPTIFGSTGSPTRYPTNLVIDLATVSNPYQAAITHDNRDEVNPAECAPEWPACNSLGLHYFIFHNISRNITFFFKYSKATNVLNFDCIFHGFCLPPFGPNAMCNRNHVAERCSNWPIFVSTINGNLDIGY